MACGGHVLPHVLLWHFVGSSHLPLVNVQVAKQLERARLLLQEDTKQKQLAKLVRAAALHGLVALRDPQAFLHALGLHVMHAAFGRSLDAVDAKTLHLRLPHLTGYARHTQCAHIQAAVLQHHKTSMGLLISP